MTIEDCYARMGANYEEVLRRLGKAERVARFLRKLPDEPSFPTLRQALQAGDAQEAFRAAHSLKGICMNLGLTALGNSASALTEALRGGRIPETAGELFAAVERDYRHAVLCIQAYALS